MSLIGNLLGTAASSLFGGAVAKQSKKDDYKYQTKLAEQQYGYQQNLAEQQYGYQQNLAEQQYGYQTQLLDSENSFNLDMWNRNNEYNSPAAQAQRLSDAGFNPSLSMGSSVAGSQVVSSSPAVTTPVSSSPSFSMPGAGNSTVGSIMSMLDAMSNLRLRDAQAKDLEASVQERGSRSYLNASESKLNSLRSQYQEILNTWANDSESSRVDNLRAYTRELNSQALLSDSKVEEINAHLPYLASLDKAQITKLFNDSNLAAQKAITEVSQRHNLDAAAQASLASAFYFKESGFTQQAQQELTRAMKVTESYKGEELLQSANRQYQEAFKSMLESDNLLNGIDSKGSMAGSIMAFLGAGSRASNSLIHGNGFDPRVSLPSLPGVGSASESYKTPVQKSEDSLLSLLAKALFGFSRQQKVSHRNPQIQGFQMGK